MGLSSNSCRSQLLQLFFGHPGGEWFPWGSSRKSVVEPRGEPRSTTALALCWAIPCVGIAILGKLLLKWMSSSMAIVILCRDGANFSKAHHLLCLGDSSPLLSTTWYNLVTVVSAQPGRNEGLYLDSAVHLHPGQRLAILFNYRFFFCVQLESFLPGSLFQ